MEHASTLGELIVEDWYLARDPGFATGSWSALAHYREKGWREGRAPNPHFDPGFYIAQCTAACRGGDPLLHYVAQGERAGRRPSPMFDPAWYRTTYRLAPEQNALAHFLRHRFTAAVSPSKDFDSRFYLETYADVAAAGCDPLEHYLTRGRLEYRLPKPELSLLAESGLFDEGFYLFFYEDVRQARADPLDHFRHSSHERRKPNIYFNPDWYYENYGSDYSYTPLTHYILIGESRGYRPGPHFDPAWYRMRYGIPLACGALAHYLRHRKTQNFAPNKDFDIDRYIAQAGKSLRADRDPFLHSLAIASRRGMLPRYEAKNDF